MNYKFNVGDKVIRNNRKPNNIYNFGKNIGIARVGKIVTICSRGTSYARPLYSVEGAYILAPNWSGMEECFDKISTWKNRLNK